MSGRAYGATDEPQPTANGAREQASSPTRRGKVEGTSGYAAVAGVIGR